MEAAAVQTAGGGAAGGDGGALNALRQVSQEHLRPVMLSRQRAASASTTSDPMILQVFRLSKLSKSQTEAQVWITVTLKATETTRVT